MIPRGDVLDVLVQEVDKARGRIGLKLVQKHENGALVSPEELIERAKDAPPREPREERPRGDRDRRGGRGGPRREREGSRAESGSGTVGGCSGRPGSPTARSSSGNSRRDDRADVLRTMCDPLVRRWLNMPTEPGDPDFDRLRRRVVEGRRSGDRYDYVVAEAACTAALGSVIASRRHRDNYELRTWQGRRVAAAA